MPFLPDVEIVSRALNQFYQESIQKQKPAIHQMPLSQLVEDLNLEDWAKNGGLSGSALEKFIETYLSGATRLHHPGFLAHQCAAPHYASGLGALIDGFTNNPMAIYEMGPGAASIEYFVINWMLAKVGWQPGPYPPNHPMPGQIIGGGVLTHGGSLANLTALIAARTRAVPDIWLNGNPGNLALLASPEAHYSIARAAGILGLGRNAIYTLPVNEYGVIIPGKLPEVLGRLKNDGKTPIALVVNACSTAVGLFDPINDVAHFCRENNVWLHVDGAHGASVLLSSRFRFLMDGVEQADSLSWDAHKMMRTASLCTAVLVRDSRTLDQAFEQEASYLFHEKEEPGFDFMKRTVECTKAGLGLKFFMVLAALGEQGLANYLERQFDLAVECYHYLRQVPGIECPVKPQSNILCFRVEGDDHRQIAIRDKLIAGGSYYLSTSEFGGRRYLRLTLMSPQTTLEEIRGLVEEIQKIK